MKKEMCFPLAVLLGILAFSLWNGAVTAEHTTRWRAQLQQADTLAQAEDWAGAMEVLSESYGDWAGRQTWLHIVLKHDCLDDAEAMYRRAMAFAAEKEPSEFRAEIADLRDQLRLLADLERFSLKNVL